MSEKISPGQSPQGEVVKSGLNTENITNGIGGTDNVGGGAGNIPQVIALTGIIIATLLAFFMPFVGPSASNMTLEEIRQGIVTLEAEADVMNKPPKHIEIGRLTQKGSLVALRSAILHFCTLVGFVGFFWILLGMCLLALNSFFGSKSESLAPALKLVTLSGIFFLGLVSGAAFMVYLVGLAITLA